MVRRIISLALCVFFFFQQAGLALAQDIIQLDITRHIGAVSTPQTFRPLHLRFFSYDPLTDNFQILLDKGDAKQIKDSQIKEQGQELLKYFLVGVALPDDNFWVNLRPDSENQIITTELARTDVGKILLEADLQLKKDVAQFTSPQTAEGREYWTKLYQKAGEIFGSENNITIPTLTRPWIVPGEVIIRQTENSAYVYKGVLKVMLEQDYLKDSADYNFKDQRLKELNEYSSQLIRQTIIPKLTQEVNSSPKYASLRQVFYSLILSRWFKARFTGKSGMYASLINTGNLKGLTSGQGWSKTAYFKEYQKSFSKGEYNIKEQASTITGPTIRTYFSGGVSVLGKDLQMPNSADSTLDGGLFNGSSPMVTQAFGNNGMPSLAGKVTSGNLVPELENRALEPAVAGSPLAIRTELTVPEGQKATFFTSDIHSYMLSELFAKRVRIIPDAIVEAVKKKLNQYVLEGKILSAQVDDYGASEIKIQVTHRFGEFNAPVQRLITEAIKEGALKAQELGLLRKDINIATMGLEDLAKALRIKREQYSINERGSESFVRGTLVGAAIGAANIKLFHGFFMPGATPLKQLGFLPKVNTIKGILTPYVIEKAGLNWVEVSEKLLKNDWAKQEYPDSITVKANLKQEESRMQEAFGSDYAKLLPVLVDSLKVGKLPVRGFRAAVRKIDDVLKGNYGPEADVFEFEKSSEAEVNGVHYPSVDQSDELEIAIGQTNETVITEIYPVEGSLVSSKEPLVKVLYQPVYGEKGELRALNPTFLMRSQSGADAVAGVVSMLADVNFVPGGENGERFVTTIPVTKKQARRAPPEGYAYLTVDFWQFKGYGQIPQETDAVMDHVGINPPAFKPEQRVARFLRSVMITHPHDQPYLAPFAAEKKVEPLRKAHNHLFKRAPKEADVDPVMANVEAKVASGKLKSFHDIKADMGGKGGHNFTPEYMLGIDIASQIEAVESGEIADGNIIGLVQKGRLKNGTTPSIGDDEHVISLGDRSANGANANQRTFTAMTRGFLAAMVGNTKEFDPSVPFSDEKVKKWMEKPYGLAQDYAGKEAKAAMANPYHYSRLNERFFEILRETMPLDYMQMVENMYKGWKYWQEYGSKGVLPKPFSGNVSSQGMGAARYVMDTANGERRVGILAGDKCGPAGINRPIREGVYALLKGLENKSAGIPEWIMKEAEELKAIQNGISSITLEDWIKKNLPGEMENFRKGRISVDDLIEFSRKEIEYLTKLLAQLEQNGMVFEIWDAKAYDEHGNIAIDEIPQNYADIADSVPELKDEAGQDNKEGQAFINNSYNKDGSLRTDLDKTHKEKLAALIKKSGFVPTKRIYLDARQDKDAIYDYLADSDRFNIKQVWVKSKAGWDINNPQDYLDKPLLGSSVTKLGILAGGAYIGKDDPVMAGNILLMEHIFEFAKNSPIQLQGDMNGSHWLAAIPTAWKFGVANKESHPILIGFRYTLSGDGERLVNAADVFSDKAFRPIREKMFEYNRQFKIAQLGGQMEPYGTSRKTIEAAYPKNQAFEQIILNPKSPFLVRNMSPEKRKLRPITQMELTGELFKVALAASPMTAAASSAMVAPEPGGVDFRVIPMLTQPMGSLSGLNFSLPKLSSSVLKNRNLDGEVKELQKLAQARITPAQDRLDTLRDLVALAYQKGELKEHLGGIVMCMVDLCQLQEEKVTRTPDSVKEVLLMVDAAD